MMGMMGVMMWLMVFGALVFLVALVGVIWLLVRWLTRRQEPPMPDTLQPPSPYQRYEQEYQPSQPMSHDYQDGEQPDRSPQPKQQFDEPYIPYPQEQEMPPRS